MCYQEVQNYSVYLVRLANYEIVFDRFPTFLASGWSMRVTDWDLWRKTIFNQKRQREQMCTSINSTERTSTVGYMMYYWTIYSSPWVWLYKVCSENLETTSRLRLSKIFLYQDRKREYFQVRLTSLQIQQTFMNQSDKAGMLTWKASSLWIAQKPYTTKKDLILPAACNMYKMMFGNNKETL